MSKIIQAVAMLLVLISCKQAGNKSGPKEQFDKLEKVFEAGNWRHVNYGDTAYIFFSREGNTDYKIYRYRLLNGDSVNTSIFNIQLQHDSIVMKVENELRVLVEADTMGSSWEDGETVYQFKKTDSSHILLKKDGEVTDTLVRTLPISAFLVRAKHDFINGTNTANALTDSAGKKR